MKIKKKTSIMMLAASTAAVVGVAAVSFAAWNNAGTTELTASAATGEVYAFGFTDADAALSFGENAALVPYNQKAETISAGSTTISAALPAYSVVAEDYSFTVTLEDSSLANGSKLYVLIDGNESATLTDWAPTEDKQGDWQEVTSTGATFTVENTEGGDHAEGEKHLHLLLVSEDHGDASKDNAFSIKVELKSNPYAD